MNYSDYQSQVSSEKLTLAILHASKRLMAWTLHSGSIYKIENFDVAAIVSIEDSGTAYTEVSSVSDVTASKFYNDRDNKILYLRTTGSDNPNSRFLVLTFRLFFSNAPITLPHDLSTGFEVYFEPMIKSTSAFGVEIDTINQRSEAIEGSGTLTLTNDNDFWISNFDKLNFDNRDCLVYSYNRELAVTEAKLIYKGKVEKKTYASDKIQFNLKDLLSELQTTVTLSNIEDLALRNSSDLNKAKQRMVLGRVYGHRLINLDEVKDGYPITGTVSISINSKNLTGSGTQFLAELSPDDEIILGGVRYSIGTVTSNTAATVTNEYQGTLSLSGVSATIIPDQPKRWNNRVWHVAGHALRQPTTTTTSGSTITRIHVGSTKDMYDGDMVYIGTLGSGELVRINKVVNSNIFTLSTSLLTPPVAGTSVFKPAVQNVKIDDVALTYYTHYTFNATTGILTLNSNAEKLAAPLLQMANNLVFTSGSRTITGTALRSLLKPGSVVSCVGQVDFFEVLSVDSDTQATLRTASTFTSTATGLYKNFILDPDNSVVTCDVLGRTTNGTSSGDLISTAPAIVRQLLVDLGLNSSLDESSFTTATDLAPQPIGLVIPEEYDEDEAPTYRDVFNKINKSVFGSVIQNNDFQFSYLVLQPNKSPSATRLTEADILSFKVNNTSDKLVKTVRVNYRPKEYDYLTKKEAYSSQQKSSTTATYLVKTDREKVFDTILCDSADAERHANRWSMILENSSTEIQIKTKLQGIRLEVGDIVDIQHRKLYERLGSTSNRKLALVEAVKKSGSDVEIQLVDLSNLFNRVAAVSSIDTSWANTDDEGRLYGGFITDQYGLIDNNDNSFGTNLIW